MVDTSIVFDLLARDRASRTVAGVGKSFDSTKSKMVGMAVKGAAAMGALTVAAGIFVVKAGAPYVASLNKIQALTGANNAQMGLAAKQLEGNAGLYAKMGQTTGDAAGGVVELVKAGLSLHQALQSVYGTMTLAKAGELGVADASSITANALNTFHLKAKQAGDVANYLANAANISSADVADIAESFKYVAPVAASAGVSIQQVNAILAELANAGIKGSNAGTGLRKFLLSLQAPSGAAAADLKKLGIQIYDSTGKMKPLGDVIGILQGKLDGLSQKGRNKVLKDVFGLQGIASAQTILDGGTKGLAQYTKGVERAGAAQKLAQAQSKGLAGTWNILKATAISTAQSLYRQLSPVVDQALRPMAIWLAKVSSHLDVASGLAKIGSVFSGLGKGGGAGGFLDQLSKTGSALKSFGAGLLPTLKSLGSQLSNTIGPGLKQIGTAVSTQLLPAFRNILPVLLPVAKFLLNLFGGAVIGALKGGVKVIVGLVTVIAGVFNLVSDLIHGRWGKLWGDFKQIISGALQVVLGAVQVWWNVGILAIFKRGALYLTKGIWKDLWAGIRSGAKSGMSAAGRLIESGVKGIGKLLLSGVKGYFAIWRRLFTVYLDVAKTGWRVLRSMFGGAVAALRSVVSHWLSAQRALFSDAWSALKGIVSRAWAAIRGAVSDGIGKVLGLVRQIPGKIKSAVGNLASTLYKAGQAVIQGLINGIGSKLGALKDKLGSVASTIKSAVTNPLGIFSPSRVFRGYGQNLLEGLVKGIEDRWIPVKSVLGKVTDYIAAQGAKVKDLLSARSDFAQGFQSFTTSVFSTDLSHTTTDAAGNEVTTPATVKDMIAYQAQQRHKARQLKADVARLHKLGLSNALIKQLQASGESGIAQIHTLAGGSRAQIQQLNQLNKQTQTALGGAGSIAAGQLYDDEIAEEQRDIRQAKRIAAELGKVLHSTGKNEYAVVKLDGRVLLEAERKAKRAKGQKPTV